MTERTKTTKASRISFNATADVPLLVLVLRDSLKSIIQFPGIRKIAIMAPAIANKPMKIPERPLSERNFVESSMIFLMVFRSSADEMLFSI